jgi:hypothetical protein
MAREAITPASTLDESRYPLIKAKANAKPTNKTIIISNNFLGSDENPLASQQKYQ